MLLLNFVFILLDVLGNGLETSGEIKRGAILLSIVERDESNACKSKSLWASFMGQLSTQICLAQNISA